MATFYGASDLDGMLSEFGVPVEWGLFCVRGIRDEADVDMLTGQAATFTGRKTGLLVKTGALPGIAAQQVIRVEGVDYRVASVAEVDDGALTRLLLAKK